MARKAEPAYAPPWRPRADRARGWAMNAAYAGLTVTLLPYALFRFVTDAKTRARWRAYMKDLPARYHRRRPRDAARPCLWVHGVSVGEIKSVAHLVEAIARTRPGIEIVVSVSTDTGHRVALERYPSHRVEFYPPDLTWIVEDAFDALRPGLIVLVESGFWPTFIHTAEKRGIPVVVVNGRMSARSAGRYRFAGDLVPSVLSTLDEVCVQLPAYGERFHALGVDSGRIHVTGNMKLDNIPIEPRDPRPDAFRSLLGPSGQRPLLVAGSTHPEEERVLARIQRRLADEGLPFRLLVAPRHPARADTVEQQVRREGATVVRRSSLPRTPPPRPEDVILLDTVGELETVYTLADLVYVGGTLVPHGGQNMMEPASLGKPVVVGPHVENFRGEVDLLLAADGLALVADEDAVEDTLRRWLGEPQTAKAVGARARAAILEGKGATERNLAILAPYLDRLEGEGPCANS